jgi:hypothetical protein
VPIPTRRELVAQVADLEKRLAAHEKATVRISLKSIADLDKRLTALEKAAEKETSKD